MKKKVARNFCNFCASPETKDCPLAQSNETCICFECAKKVVYALKQHKEVKAIETDIEYSPKKLKAWLDRFVIGQENAKKRISVAVSDHYRRIKNLDNDNEEENPVVIEKSNVLLIGSTGSGKTHIARALAKKLGVPFAIGDATTITEAGYVGEDVENLILKLIVNADYDIEQAQRGIIYIDELDKTHRTSQNVSITRDVSGEGVQQSLLKMIEGTTSNIPPQGGRKHPEQQYLQVDTTNILFICGGTFVGLEDIIARRLGKGTMGFHNDGSDDFDHENKRALLSKVTPQDLEQYGMIPELIGRLPIIAVLEELTVEDLERILTEPVDAILKQKKKLVRSVKDKSGKSLYDITFTDEAIKEIAKLAKEKETGARALRSVVEDFMVDIMYNLDDNKPKTRIVITDKLIRGEQKFPDIESFKEVA